MRNTPRKVATKTIFDAMKRRPVLLIIGILFTVIPIFVVTILVVVFTAIAADVPEIDYELINKTGGTTSATITDIKTVQNVTINNEHPTIISYRYTAHDRDIESKYKVLAPDKVAQMKIGDAIRIKYLADGSIIDGFEPFSFPNDILGMAFTPLLIIGPLFLFLLYRRVTRELDLFRYGKAMTAELISMTLKTASRGNRNVQLTQRIVVHYQYKNSRGENVLGESATTDVSILNAKSQGDPIKIFVSEEDESKSTMVQRLDEIRNNWKLE